MSDFSAAAMNGPPLFTDINDANREIAGLRETLIREREKYAKLFVHLEEVKRSMAGNLKIAFDRAARAEKALEAVKNPSP